MTPAELRAIMDRNELTAETLALLLRLRSARTVQHWLAGTRKISPMVALLIETVVVR